MIMPLAYFCGFSWIVVQLRQTWHILEMMAKGSCMQQHVKKIKWPCGKKIRDFTRDLGKVGQLGKAWPTVFRFFCKTCHIMYHVFVVGPISCKGIAKNCVFSNDSAMILPKQQQLTPFLHRWWGFLSPKNLSDLRLTGENLDWQHCVHHRLRWWLCLLDHRNATGEAMGTCRMGLVEEVKRN